MRLRCLQKGNLLLEQHHLALQGSLVKVHCAGVRRTAQEGCESLLEIHCLLGVGGEDLSAFVLKDDNRELAVAHLGIGAVTGGNGIRENSLVGARLPLELPDQEAPLILQRLNQILHPLDLIHRRVLLGMLLRAIEALLDVLELLADVIELAIELMSRFGVTGENAFRREVALRRH